MQPDATSGQLRRLVEEVRAYRDRHEVLRQAHHFLFALPIEPASQRFDVLVMGVNPGEQPSNWALHCGPTEETLEYDWLAALNQRTGPAKRWRTHLQTFCGDRRALMSEFFFWSSKNAGADFVARFGTSLRRSPHLEFCCTKNIELINVVRPQAVICPGLSDAAWFARIYELSHRQDLVAANGHLLVQHFERDAVPWLFTKHWSGSFGFTAEQRQQVRSYIDKVTPAPRQSL